MRTGNLLLAVRLVVVLCVLGLLSPSGARANESTQSHQADRRNLISDFRDKSDEKTLTFEVKEGARQVRLQVRLAARQGEIAFRLIDPTGRVRLQGSVEEGKGSFDTREIPAVVGEWSLHVSRRKATGEYEWQWKIR